MRETRISNCVKCGKEKEGKYQSYDWICDSCAHELGKELKSLREGSGLTMNEWSQKTGLSKERWRQIEGGWINKLSNYKKWKALLESEINNPPLTFEIPKVPPSANKYERMFWKDKWDLKQEWFQEVKYSIMEAVKYPAKLFQNPYRNPQVVVELIFPYEPKRDKQNNVTPVDKLIIDSLVQLGILHDDKNIVPIITMKKGRGKRARTRVTITEGGENDYID